MTDLRAQQLSTVYREIASLRYEHPEGAAYVYVRFLSLLRNLPALVSDKKSMAEFNALQEKMNEALCARFTDQQHGFFMEAQQRILQLLDAQLTPSERLAAAVTAF